MIPSISILIELCCLFIAVYFLRNSKKNFSKITIGYLLLVCATEIFGMLWAKSTQTSNEWIYNIFILFEVTYISFGLYVTFKPLTKYSLLALTTSIITFFCAYTFELNQNSILKFNATTILIQSILFVLLSSYYYYLIFKHKEPINLKLNDKFWWVTGIYIYYFGGTIYNLFIQNLTSNIVLTYTMLFLNLLLYSIWSYSFICTSRQQK